MVGEERVELGVGDKRVDEDEDFELRVWMDGAMSRIGCWRAAKEWGFISC